MPQLPKNNENAAAASRTATTTTTTSTSTSDNPLMTPKALALSLSPPRVPPFGTIQRALYHHHSTHKNHQQTKRLYDKILHHWWWSSHYSHIKNGRGNHCDTPDRTCHGNDHNGDQHYHVRTIDTATTTTTASKSDPKHRAKATHPSFRRRFIRERDKDDANASRNQHNILITNSKTDKTYHYPRQHPYLQQQSNDRITRYLFGLGRLLSLEQQNYLRDAGIFRTIVDTLATTTIPPILLLSNPPSKILLPYIQLKQICQTIPYGPNPSYQYIHLYPSPLPPPPPSTHVAPNHMSQDPPQQRRLIVFVHGGAWGSGQPWMYRLMAAPFLFPKNNANRRSRNRSEMQPPPLDSDSYSVAVIGHRTYPDGNTLEEQVSDIRTALNVLIEQYSHLFDHSNITIVGHSSGAHVGLCMVVDYIKEQLYALQQKVDCGDPIPVIESLPFDSFCGISGPYDISHHFDYESARGVEEISPMKPVNGSTRPAFRSNSPLWRLSNDVLMYLNPNVESQLYQICPNIAFIHGIEDETVPFTATAEAARLLRRLGIKKVQEIYVPHTGHQDAILQCMIGGRTCDVLLQWISNLQHPSSDENQPTITKINSRL